MNRRRKYTLSQRTRSFLLSALVAGACLEDLRVLELHVGENTIDLRNTNPGGGGNDVIRFNAPSLAVPQQAGDVGMDGNGVPQCFSSNKIGGAAATPVIIHGGQALGAVLNIGTTDANGVNIRTNGKISGGFSTGFFFVQDPNSVRTVSITAPPGAGTVGVITTTDQLRVDATSSLAIGTVNASSVTIGGIASLTMSSGGGTAASLDAATALNLGNTTATSVQIGKTGAGNTGITLGTTGNITTNLNGTWNVTCNSAATGFFQVTTGILAVNATSGQNSGSFVQNFALFAINSGAGNSSAGIALQCGSNGGTGALFMDMRRPDGTQVGNINQSGAAAMTYASGSDVRFKMRVDDDTPWGLAHILKIDPFSYRQVSEIDGTPESDDVHHGIGAQHLYEIYPHAVYRPRDKDGNFIEHETYFDETWEDQVVDYEEDVIHHVEVRDESGVVIDRRLETVKEPRQRTDRVCVKRDKKQRAARWGIDYGKLTPLLVVGQKEAAAMMKAMAAQIEKLEERIAGLEGAKA